MLLALLKTIVPAIYAVYLLLPALRHLHSHAPRGWNALLARLSRDWSARHLSDHFLWQEGLSATPENVWQLLEGPRGLCVIFRNTGVLLAMADYATRNNPCVDPMMLANLRSDAMQIRLCVLMALLQYGFSHLSEGVRVNSLRAASLYTAMAARMTCLLQDHAAGILPAFVEAM